MTHDGSELASAAVPHATDLARSLGASLVLLRVTETAGELLARLGGGWVPAGGTAAEVAETEVERLRDEARAELESLREKIVADGVSDVRVEVVEGSAGRAIVDVAKQLECDLIVMSTRGRSGLGRALLGSVADSVVRHSPVPVVVRAADEDEESA